MSIWMFWKLFGDACLYFSAIGAFPKLFPHDFSLLLPAILCGIGGMAASWLSNRGHDILARLGLLPVLCVLLLPNDAIEAITLLPVLLYTAIVILRGEYALEYLSFRGFFRRSILIWSIGFALLCLASAVEGIANPWSTTISYDETLFMGVLYGVSGIILQRQLRMGVNGTTADKRLNSIQSAVVLGGTGAVMLGFWALQRYIAENGREAMNALGELLLYICTLPLALVVWILSPFFEEFTAVFEETQEATEITEENVEHIVTVFSGEATTEPVKTVVSAARYPWWLAMLLLSLLLILLLVLLNQYRKKAGKASAGTVFEDIPLRERRKHESRTTNRTKIRRCYREHLKLERRRGLRLGTNQTSADILARISPETDKAAAGALRQVYLKARYDKKTPVTNEDVQQAREALKKLRG